MRRRWIGLAIAALGFSIGGCAGDAPQADCIDELENPVPCEALGDVPELPDDAYAPETAADLGGADAPEDLAAEPGDLDAIADAGPELPWNESPEGERGIGIGLEPASAAAAHAPDTAIAFGRTKNAERRELVPIGRTPGAQRYVVMRLKPSDLPGLRAGDVLRAAAEIQVTTRCDVGQIAPGCGYSPNVRMQLLLSGRPDATDPRGPGTIALSKVKGFSCTKDDHHCVEVIDFAAASATLEGARLPGCVADDSCFVNLVLWSYDRDARSGGRDRLLIGANEKDFLQNGKVEQDRGRIMAVRKRDVTPADELVRVTGHTVRNGAIGLASNGDWKRLYSHALKAGNDLKAGESYEIVAEVDATSNARVNLSLQMFLTRNRFDHNGGGIDGVSPAAISEHNGTNCSPGNPCHLRKVAVLRVDHDLAGPVYVNVIGAAEVPGPGSANVTIQDQGFVKSLRYAQ